MPTTIDLHLAMTPLGALCSHDPLYFASKPEARSEMTTQSASRLLFMSNWKLSSESSCEEPRLRRLLGHISVYDSTRAFVRGGKQPSEPTPESGELSTYLQHHVPSFKEFQAAIEVQLATLAQIKVASTHCDNVEEYNSDEEDDDDSDYDSCDGECEWSDDDTTVDSDESFTDNESMGSSPSEPTSPTFCPESLSESKEREEGLWAIRPLVHLVKIRPPEVS